MTDFEEYIKQSEPHKKEKGYAWQTAIGNLILGEQNELKNRYLSIDISQKVSLQSIKKNISKSQNDTLKYTLEEMALLRCISENPCVTQKEIAQRINKSIVTVKRLTIAMTEKGIIERKNGKRNGYWELKTTSIMDKQ